MALGGEAGRLLAHRLSMPTSGDTLLRLIRATPVATVTAPPRANTRVPRAFPSACSAHQRRASSIPFCRVSRGGSAKAARTERSCGARSGGLGFAGTAKQVRRWLQVRRTALYKHTPRRWRDVVLPGATAAVPATRELLAPIQPAWPTVKAAEARYAKVAETIVRIEQDAEAATLIRAAEITGKRQTPGVDTFDAWLADARDCGVRAVVTLAAGLEQDGAAVRAAVALLWSNGQTEGRGTKLKLLKRSTRCARLGWDQLWVVCKLKDAHELQPAT